MILPLAAMVALAQRCAPAVAPETLLSVARAESGFNPLAIGVNRGPVLRRQPSSVSQAIATANRLLAEGANIDLGIAQINSRNLTTLHLSVADAFDPCKNLAASADMLEADYGASQGFAVSPQAALGRTFSLYNTGDPARGYFNGYVLRVRTAARWVVPAISGMPPPQIADAAPPPTQADVVKVSTSPQPPAWDVFARGHTAEESGGSVLVFAR